MQPDTSPKDERSLPPEFITRLYAQFDTHMRTFRISFGALLVFTIVFFYMVYQPMIRIERERERINLRLAESARDTLLASRDLARILYVEEQLNDFEKLLEEAPQQLKDWLRKLSAGEHPEIGVMMGLTSSFCDFSKDKDKIEWVKCELRNVFYQSYFEIEVKSRQHALHHILDSLVGYRKGSLSPEALDLKVNRLLSDVKNLLEVTWQDTWVNRPGKFYEEVDRIFRNPLDEISSSVNGILNGLSASARARDNSHKLLVAHRDSLKARETEIQEKLKHIQFPLFSLPVDLTEYVELYPILITIGFILCVYLYTNMLHVRRALIDFHLARHFTTREFEFSLPFLLDPAKKLRRQIPVLIVFLIPLAFYVFSLLLSLEKLEFEPFLGKQYQQGTQLFVIHGLCTVALVLGYFNLLRHFRP